jgi:anti-sigma regulatory factor (Ser/Thr protein kinase)
MLDDRESAVAIVLAVPYDATGPSVARHFVQQFAEDYRLGQAAELVMIVSELVTNAIVHGAAPVRLTLLHRDGETTIEVADGDAEIDRVKLRRVDRSEPGGKGLAVVASLANRWGARLSPPGKTVWATM